jgi:hypothetical protein
MEGKELLEAGQGGWVRDGERRKEKGERRKRKRKRRGTEARFCGPGKLGRSSAAPVHRSRKSKRPGVDPGLLKLRLIRSEFQIGN